MPADPDQGGEAPCWAHFVDDLRDRMVANGIDASTIENRWGSPGFFVFDPAGNRIEFWSDST